MLARFGAVQDHRGAGHVAAAGAGGCSVWVRAHGQKQPTK